MKTSRGGGRGSRSSFFIKLAQKSLSYTFKNIFRTLVLDFEKKVGIPRSRHDIQKSEENIETKWPFHVPSGHGNTVQEL